MRHPRRYERWLRGGLLGVAVGLLAPAGALAGSLHPALLAKVSYGSAPLGFARGADGTLHVAYQTNINWGDSANGIGAEAISPSGRILPPVQALSWGGSGGSPNGIPGLSITPNGVLQAVFGGSPSGDDGPWGISSTDGGATWSSPTDVGSGSMETGDGTMTLQNSGGTPVFTGGCCGGIVIQQGLGPGSPTSLLTNNSDNAAGNVASAVDAVSGAVIASWDSNAGSGGIWVQQAAPTPGTAVKVPIPSQYGNGKPLILAGRDTGPGVFAAYPSNNGNTTQMDLLRYGGGSVRVGAARNMHAAAWGAATGPDGRIWVMWYGQNTKTGNYELAVTRSNKAITAFEPIQVFPLSFGMFWLAGDGRLGPLDMFISGSPNTANAPSGIYYARFRPELSSRVSVHRAGNGKFTVSVRVTDAGDPVSGAKTSAKGHSKTAGSNGLDKLTLKGSSRTKVTMTITDGTYQTLKIRVKL